MPITVTCDSCGRTVKVSDTWAGRRGKCPQCKAILTVPDVPTVQPLAEGAGAGAPAAAPLPVVPRLVPDAEIVPLDRQARPLRERGFPPEPRATPRAPRAEPWAVNPAPVAGLGLLRLGLLIAGLCCILFMAVSALLPREIRFNADAWDAWEPGERLPLFGERVTLSRAGSATAEGRLFLLLNVLALFVGALVIFLRGRPSRILLVGLSAGWCVGALFWSIAAAAAPPSLGWEKGSGPLAALFGAASGLVCFFILGWIGLPAPLPSVLPVALPPPQPHGWGGGSSEH
jgi:hypothetical protein